MSETVERLRTRASAYLFLSRMLLYPEDGFDGDASLRHLAEAMTINTGDARSPRLEALREDYLRFFDHKDESPLNEFTYCKNECHDISILLADIAGFYRAFNVQTAGRERHDHIGTELEFMALVMQKEYRAREEVNTEAAEVCRDIARAFFRDHLGRFYLPVSDYLRDTSHPFYARAGKSLATFLRRETRLYS